MHILVAEYQTGVSGYRSVKTIEEAYTLVCGDIVEDVFYHVGKSTTINIDTVYQFMTIISKVRNIYVVDKTDNYNKVLHELGVRCCSVYLNEYIDTEEDFEFVRRVSDATINVKNDLVIDSLLNNIETVKTGIDRLIQFCEGSIGFMEVTEEDKVSCNRFNYVMDEVSKFIKTYKKDNSKTGMFEPIIKLLGENIYKMKEGYNKELANSVKLKKEMDVLNRRYDELLFDYNLYKENSKLFLFPTPYFVRKGKTKVLYVKEYSKCSYLASTLFNFRLYLTNAVKNSTSFFVICQHNYGLQEQRFNSYKNPVNLNAVDLSTIQKPETLPIAYMFEQNDTVWDKLFDYGFSYIIVLDRFYVKNPILTIENEKVGFDLCAINSQRDLVTFEIDPNKVIMSVETKGRYLIPHMEGFRGKKPDVQFNMYLDKMGAVYREWLRRLK